MSLVISLVIGITIGLFIKLNKKILNINSKIQIVILFSLLFFMGVSLGINPEILSNLKQIGIASFLFATFTVLLSIGFTYVFHKLLIKEL
ncbi:MAG: LysO family transporter [Bacillota bacterium]|nr:LysO family transporter [Bacillota bacterium]